MNISRIGQIDDDAESLNSTSFYSSTYDLFHKNEQASSIFETEKLTNGIFIYIFIFYACKNKF